MANLNLKSSKNERYIISDEKKLNISESSENYSLSTKYHYSEIEQNRTIMYNAVIMIWVGIVLIFLGMIFALFMNGATKIFALIPGMFVDVFSGTMIHLVNKSSESKQKYFENLTIVEHEQRIIELIHTSDDEKFRQEMVSKIVDRHCKM